MTDLDPVASRPRSDELPSIDDCGPRATVDAVEDRGGAGVAGYVYQSTYERRLVR